MTTEQAAHQAELLTEFLHDENEEARSTPGPYEQGANQVRRETMRDLYDLQYFD